MTTQETNIEATPEALSTLEEREQAIQNELREMEERKKQLEKELKDRVSELAFLAAEKVLLKTVDQKANKELVNGFLKELESKDPKYKLG